MYLGYSGFQNESGTAALAEHTLKVQILMSLHPSQLTESESRVGPAISI